MEYYQLSSTVYLPRNGDNYTNLLTLDVMPKNTSSLYPFVKKLNYTKLSPFDVNGNSGSSNYINGYYTNCNQRPSCINAIVNPYESKELLCVNQVSLLIRFLIENGYKFDYDTSKLLMKNSLPIANNKYSKMIGFITKS
jgi:hypothetical protein